MYDIDNALSWEFRELITSESETILPLFLLEFSDLAAFSQIQQFRYARGKKISQ